MTPWQDIATAPRDGTEVIVYVNSSGTSVIHIAWYRSPEEIEKFGGFGNDFMKEDVGWWSYTENSVGQSMVYPTHWMELIELPGPPK
jgi:hypothetical protein